MLFFPSRLQFPPFWYTHKKNWTPNGLVLSDHHWTHIIPILASHLHLIFVLERILGFYRSTFFVCLFCFFNICQLFFSLPVYFSVIIDLLLVLVFINYIDNLHFVFFVFLSSDFTVLYEKVILAFQALCHLNTPGICTCWAVKSLCKFHSHLHEVIEVKASTDIGKTTMTDAAVAQKAASNNR